MSRTTRRRTRRDPGTGRASATVFALMCALLTACTGSGAPEPGIDSDEGAVSEGATVLRGATIIDGTESGAIQDGVMVLREGRVAAVGTEGEVSVPADANVVELDGLFVMPGIINAHGHVGSARGLESGPDVYTRENILDQLRLNARYGITTVVSLGGDGPEGVRIRDEQDTAELERSRLFVAGPVLSPDSPEEAEEDVAELAEMGVDWVKIRVDDFLGRGQKMSPDVYTAVIEAAHANGLPLAAHIVDLEDAKGVVEAGADLVAHSVRDAPVDHVLLGLMRDNDVCLSPTLAREVSTYVYRDRPTFFDDPFFTREADSDVLETLMEPERQRRMRDSESARWYEEALPLAQENLRETHDVGVGIALGTDSGPAARFQGYFEHMEMELMADAGLEPEEILRAATGEAARCMGIDEELGTLETGKWADFIVLRADPRDDVRNARTIESVWIAGNEVPGSRWDPADTGVNE